MRLKFLFFLSFAIFFLSCSGQRLPKNELVIADFNWKLKIPDFLVTENKEEWDKVVGAGLKGMSDTYGVDVKNKAHNIFVFKSQNGCFFEAVSEPFNTSKDYITTCKKMNDMVYHVLTTQIPNAQIDTSSSVVMVSNIPFQTLTTKVVYASGNTRNTVTFRSLFKYTELTVTAMFSDQQSGNQIIEAFKKSSFGKE